MTTEALPATPEDLVAVKQIAPELSGIFDEMLEDGSIVIVDQNGEKKKGCENERGNPQK